MARATGSRSGARRSALHSRGVDLLLDRDGLWCTAPGGGPGVLRSVPVPGGMAPGRVWGVPCALTLDPDDLTTLRSPLPRQDAQELLAAAEAVVPHPWRPVEPTP